MGRAAKRRKAEHRAGVKPKLPHRNAKYNTAPPPPPSKKPSQKAGPKKEQHTEPTIPFDPLDRILVLGDGDLSFGAALAAHHGCADLLVTAFDPEPTLLVKYPQARAHRDTIVEHDQRVLCGVDATKLSQKEIRKGRRWDRIIFNFPHVGGKSTDVNRQVRYNQELLVNFFKAALPLLARPDGTIIVTLFEGEPYTLWNVRDLARHVGLRVIRSFKFQPAAYPGYKHARTLGNIEGGGGAWKGEDRPSRTYVFGVPDEDAGAEKKRKRAGSESDDD